MVQAIGFVGIILVLCLGLFLYTRMLNGKVRKQMEQYSAEHDAAVAAPDWAFYAEFLGRPVPEALRRFYDNRKEVEQLDLEFDDGNSLNQFEPIGPDDVLDTKEDYGYEILAFASDIYGNPLYLIPGANQTNAVFTVFHDGGDGPEMVAPDVTQFIKELRAGK